jgi:hypothetical protein
MVTVVNASRQQVPNLVTGGIVGSNAYPSVQFVLDRNPTETLNPETLLNVPLWTGRGPVVANVNWLNSSGIVETINITVYLDDKGDGASSYPPATVGVPLLFALTVDSVSGVIKLTGFGVCSAATKIGENDPVYDSQKKAKKQLTATTFVPECVIENRGSTALAVRVESQSKIIHLASGQTSVVKDWLPNEIVHFTTLWTHGGTAKTSRFTLDILENQPTHTAVQFFTAAYEPTSEAASAANKIVISSNLPVLPSAADQTLVVLINNTQKLSFDASTLKWKKVINEPTIVFKLGVTAYTLIPGESITVSSTETTVSASVSDGDNIILFLDKTFNGAFGSAFYFPQDALITGAAIDFELVIKPGAAEIFGSPGVFAPTITVTGFGSWTTNELPQPAAPWQPFQIVNQTSDLNLNVNITQFKQMVSTTYDPIGMANFVVSVGGTYQVVTYTNDTAINIINADMVFNMQVGTADFAGLQFGDWVISLQTLSNIQTLSVTDLLAPQPALLAPLLPLSA